MRGSSIKLQPKSESLDRFDSGYHHAAIYIPRTWATPARRGIGWPLDTQRFWRLGRHSKLHLMPDKFHFMPDEFHYMPDKFHLMPDPTTVVWVRS